MFSAGGRTDIVCVCACVRVGDHISHLCSAGHYLGPVS